MNSGLEKKATKHIHMLGVAGSAMAPVAGMLKERGFRVTGSDVNVYPPASTLLDSLGIAWNEGYRAENLTPAPNLAVIGNAISRGNPEVERILDEKIPYCSMPRIIEDYFLAGARFDCRRRDARKNHDNGDACLDFPNCGPTAQLSNRWRGSEFWDRSYGLGGGKEFIIEGDEYDTAFFDKGPKFLHYHPDELIFTSLEYDHADIYPDLAAIALQFRRLVNLVPRRGRILIWGGSRELKEVAAKAFCPVETFGLAPECDWQASDIVWDENATKFRVIFRGNEVARIRIPVAGTHNVLNALAAIALAHGRGVDRDAIEQALATFQSVRRRMEIKGEAGGVLVVEDFAHHPTAIRLTLEAARMRWPNRRIWVAIEPRSNTMRRKIFQEALPEALSLADVVLFGPVNRAQLLVEGERLSPEGICELIRARGHKAEACDSAEDIANRIASGAKPSDLVLIMSNGGFDGLTAKLLEKLRAPVGARG